MCRTGEPAIGAEAKSSGASGNLDHDRVDDVTGTFFHELMIKCSLPAPAVFHEHINVQVAENNHNDVNIGDPETQSFENCQDINDVMQLCKLTIALSKHPLHSAATSATQILCRKTVRLADLEIGRLLSVTAQISTILARIVSLRTVDELSQADTSCHRQAQSTVLLVLSCYSRLEVMFSGAIDALQQLRKSNKLLDDSHTLMTGVVIDGFSLGTSQELQVRFITQLCEQTRGMILQATEECKEPNSTTLYGIGVAIGKLLSP